MKHISASTLVIPLLLVSSSCISADLLTVGDTFPEFSARDQHEQDYAFAPGTSAVLVAFDMSTAKAANRYLADQPVDFLTANKAVYIANIFGMPRIGRLFALPKMQRYPRRIILADGESQLARFPRQETRVTVIRLNDRAVVQSIDYWNPEQEPLARYLR